MSYLSELLIWMLSSTTYKCLFDTYEEISLIRIFIGNKDIIQDIRMAFIMVEIVMKY